MKLKLSGKTRRPTARRSTPDAKPGTLLGERTSTCFRCGRVLPEKSLHTVPPNAAPGQSRILVCENCTGA